MNTVVVLALWMLFFTANGFNPKPVEFSRHEWFIVVFTTFLLPVAFDAKKLDGDQ